VDGQTAEDQTVTLRDRDTTEQIRVSIPELMPLLQTKLEAG
jgi:glycyl-tRNA synthetase (class II)